MVEEELGIVKILVANIRNRRNQIDSNLAIVYTVELGRLFSESLRNFGKHIHTMFLYSHTFEKECNTYQTEGKRS